VDRCQRSELNDLTLCGSAEAVGCDLLKISIGGEQTLNRPKGVDIAILALIGATVNLNVVAPERDGIAAPRLTCGRV